jgi:hypothetical protein
MTIDSLTYFETLDVERSLNEATSAAKSLLWAINDLHSMLDDTEHAAPLDALATAIEEANGLIDDVWGQIIGRQEELERQEEFDEEEEEGFELVTASCS